MLPIIPQQLVISASSAGIYLKNRKPWPACCFIFTAAWANAGVVYDVSVRSLNPSFALNPSTEPNIPAVSQYFVEGGSVRVGGTHAKTVRLFKDRTLYVIDHTSRSIHVLEHATLAEYSAHYAAAVKQLQDTAAKAPPDDRAQAERRAADMKAAGDRLLMTVPREYRMTARFESVDGHDCRVWEERENDTKRLELCVAPASTIQGGPDIVSGIKILSRFRQGARFALGVDFGLSEWWPDIAGLGGVPLFIREFKYDSLTSELTLSAIHQSPADASLFDLPDGYSTQEGPDYSE